MSTTEPTPDAHGTVRLTNRMLSRSSQAGVPCDSVSQSPRTGEPVSVAGVRMEAARWERVWTGHERGFRKLQVSDPGAGHL